LVPRPGAAALLPGAALVLVTALLALAAAQPVVATVRRGEARTDAEALVVVDISRSMLARRRPTGLTRIDRARRIAKDVRGALPGVPVGVASLTDRVLPHIFPTTNQDVFVATVDRALGIEKPPPDRRTGRGRATSLRALAALGTANFFRPEARKRVAVVITDGESLPLRAGPLAAALKRANVTLLLVHVWGIDERIYRANGVPVREYLADPDTPGFLTSLANAIGARVFDEDDATRVAAAAGDAIGSGPTGPSGRELQSLELAPYALLASFVPLVFLVWRRNLS
nr:VWA domain-containing protein [Actinomycetota bacterium]